MIGKCIFYVANEPSKYFSEVHQNRPLFHLFSSFQTNIIIFTTNKCKICHPVYGRARIRTHDPQNMCLLPKPLDQGSRPTLKFVYKIYCWSLGPHRESGWQML